MKIRSMVLILAVCAVAIALTAADNPSMGTWKLNEAKSKIAAGAGKNTTVVYSAAGDQTKVTTDGVDASGKPGHSEWTGKFDGKPNRLVSFRQECVPKIIKIIATHSGSRSGISPFRRASA